MCFLHRVQLKYCLETQTYVMWVAKKKILSRQSGQVETSAREAELLLWAGSHTSVNAALRVGTKTSSIVTNYV